MMLTPVATVLTVYGIETSNNRLNESKNSYNVATVLTVYGIETQLPLLHISFVRCVATVFTVYGMRRRGRGSRGAK